MRNLEIGNAAPMAVGNGVDRTGASEGNQTKTVYPARARTATEFAASVVAARFHLSPCIARLVCELASIGGRLA